MITVSNPSHGDFAFMLGLGAGGVGALVGLLTGLFFACQSHRRRERCSWVSASITFVVLSLGLFLVFAGFLVD
jgi:hypothetical protein